jgi:hypothetical protein
MVNRINFVLISAIAALLEWALLLFLRKDALVRGAMPTNSDVSLTNSCCYLLTNLALLTLSHRRTNPNNILNNNGLAFRE